MPGGEGALQNVHKDKISVCLINIQEESRVSPPPLRKIVETEAKILYKVTYLITVYTILRMLSSRQEKGERATERGRVTKRRESGGEGGGEKVSDEGNGKGRGERRREGRETGQAAKRGERTEQAAKRQKFERLAEGARVHEHPGRQREVNDCLILPDLVFSFLQWRIEGLRSRT